MLAQDRRLGNAGFGSRVTCPRIVTAPGLNECPVSRRDPKAYCRVSKHLRLINR
jgi:hypothetical protein